MKEEETYEFYREQTLLLTKEYKELKQRIDKAVEFVEKWKYEDGDGSIFFDINTNPTELLDILEGKDKERYLMM